ncbi:hypothetical protein Mahau_0445 [Mahella australiensis 50-1 BON]|uniref:Uncharacterized protein n=1 Tax=Mahella australiensis (strain DSM 15567 / CIP 107919 / 50-1 BON) TaxID=697281 RepID=F3ZYR4_MAHA5|nr:hypothetical protein Mahau_0445 [Mahella australiensis 50-1 BON]
MTNSSANDMCCNILEQILFEDKNYCLSEYMNKSGSLLIESWKYVKGELFIPNSRFPQYRLYTADDAYTYSQLLLLLPLIIKNNTIPIVYNANNCIFTRVFYKLLPSLDNIVMYKLLSPMVAFVEYNAKTLMLQEYRTANVIMKAL